MQHLVGFLLWQQDSDQPLHQRIVASHRCGLGWKTPGIAKAGGLDVIVRGDSVQPHNRYPSAGFIQKTHSETATQFYICLDGNHDGVGVTKLRYYCATRARSARAWPSAHAPTLRTPVQGSAST